MTLSRLEGGEKTFFSAMRALRINNKINIPSINNQGSGLKNIQPNNRLNTIRKGNRHLA
jgi:hypothetical protein